MLPIVWVYLHSNLCSVLQKQSFLQQIAFWPFKVIQAIPRSMILVPSRARVRIPISPLLQPLIMAARQLASWRPLCFTEVGLCFCPRTYFFRRQISEVSGPIVTNLCRMFGGDCSFKNLVRNLGVHPPKIWRPKNVKILARFRTSRLDRECLHSPDGNKVSSIGKRRWKLQSFPYAPTKFGEFWSTNGENRTGISTNSMDFFGRSYLRG